MRAGRIIIVLPFLRTNFDPFAQKTEFFAQKKGSRVGLLNWVICNAKLNLVVFILYWRHVGWQRIFLLREKMYER